jgi:uncharacterized protein YfiM (DUF2279 family)
MTDATTHTLGKDMPSTTATTDPCMHGPLRRALPAMWALVFVLVTGTARAQHREGWFGADKALHVSASALVAGGGYALGAWAFEARGPRVLLGMGLGLAAGVGKEVVDLVGFGDPSWRDLVWDVFGVGVGIAVAYLVDLALSPSSPARGAEPQRPSPSARRAIVVGSW